jgi:2'-5' RNA ligase
MEELVGGSGSLMQLYVHVMFSFMSDFEFVDGDIAQQRHRLFFALLPDAPARAEIGRLARMLKGVHSSYADLIAPGNLHVSLFFIDAFRGAMPERLLAGALAAGAAVRGAPFALTFNQTGTFAKPGETKRKSYPFVLFGDRDAGAALTLRRAVGAAMRSNGLGYAVKDVNAFAPHVTLWWDEAIVEAHPVAPVSWTARELVLIDSARGTATHNHLARWPLGA